MDAAGRRPAPGATWWRRLCLAFSTGLFVSWFTDYFGLTGAAEPVFLTVVPALVLWFAALTAAYRYRLLDRALGLRELAAVGAPRG